MVTDPSKYKTAIKGCEVVPANMTNVFSLNHALLGASYAFLVPRVIDNMEADQFTKLAKFLADAAKGAELEHCIWYCMEGPDSLNGRQALFHALGDECTTCNARPGIGHPLQVRLAHTRSPLPSII